MDPRTLSIVVGVLAALLMVAQRNRIFDLTCMGAFFLSQTVFVLVGVLAAPWLIGGYLDRSYGGIKWGLVGPEDLARTIVVVAGGMVLVVIGHVAGDAAVAVLGRRRRQWASLLWPPAVLSSGFSSRRLRLVSVLALVFALGMLATRWRAAVAGLWTGYVGLQLSEQYAARFEMQELGLAYYLVIFNALPFLTVLTWMRFQARQSAGRRIQALTMVAATGFLLLTTFEKRPLVLFLICLAAGHGIARAYFAGASLRLRGSVPLSPRYWLRVLPWWSLTVAIGFPFLLLVGFYALSTNIVANEESASVAFLRLTDVTLARIFGRLAVMPILYCTYFPAMDPHYGFSNIGKLSALMGGTLYEDTVRVLHHFTGEDFGSGAIGTIVDFYAAFGWVGWMVASAALGLALNVLDRWLQSLPATLLNRVLYLFMLVFSYYLSQATVARSLSTYGGATFLLLWAVLSFRPWRARHPGSDR